MDRTAWVDKLNEVLRWEYAGLVQSTHFSFVVRGPLREVSATLEKLLWLVKAVDSPSFGDHLDTGNFQGDDPYDDLAQLAPYAINVQITRDLSELDPHAVSHSASQFQNHYPTIRASAKRVSHPHTPPELRHNRRPFVPFIRSGNHASMQFLTNTMAIKMVDENRVGPGGNLSCRPALSFAFVGRIGSHRAGPRSSPLERGTSSS